MSKEMGFFFLEKLLDRPWVRALLFKGHAPDQSVNSPARRDLGLSREQMVYFLFGFKKEHGLTSEGMKDFLNCAQAQIHFVALNFSNMRLRQPCAFSKLGLRHSKTFTQLPNEHGRRRDTGRSLETYLKIPIERDCVLFHSTTILIYINRYCNRYKYLLLHINEYPRDY